VGDTTELDDDQQEEEEAKQMLEAAKFEKKAVGPPSLTPQRKSEKAAEFRMRKTKHDVERREYFAHLRGALALLQSGKQLLAEVREEYKREVDKESQAEAQKELSGLDEDSEENYFGVMKLSGLDHALEYLE